MPTGIYEKTYSASIEDEIYSARLSKINLDNISNHIKFSLSEEESLVVSNCEILKKYENILYGKSILIQISEDYYYRPEMISLKLYNTTELWYLILFLNKLESSDKLEYDVIRVLDPDAVNTLLEMIVSEQKKINSKENASFVEDLCIKKLTDKSDTIIKKVFKRYKPVKIPEYSLPTIRKVFSTNLYNKVPTTISDNAKTIISKIIDNKKICSPASIINKDTTITFREELLIKSTFPNIIKPLFFGGCKILFKGMTVFEEENNINDIINSLNKTITPINNNTIIINENRIIREDIIVFARFSQSYTGDVIVNIKDTSNNITKYNFSIKNSSIAYIPVIFNSGIYNDDNTGILEVSISFNNTVIRSSKYGYYTFKEVILPIQSFNNYQDISFIYEAKFNNIDNYSFFNPYISYNFKKFVPIDSSFYHTLTEEKVNNCYENKVILTDLGKSKPSDDLSISVDVSINNYNTTHSVGVFFKRKQEEVLLGGSPNHSDEYYLYCLSVKDFKTEKSKGKLNGLYKIEIASSKTYKITRPGSSLIGIDMDKDFYLTGKKIANTPQFLTGNEYPTNIRIGTEGSLITVYDETNKAIIEYRDYSPITENPVYSNTLEELNGVVGSLSYGIFEFTDKSFTEDGSEIKINNLLINKLGYEKLGGNN